MAERITPLAPTVPIVNSDGTPTIYFQRQWSALLQELTALRARVAVLEGP